MSQKTQITVAYGDGIGPDIMKATIKILDAAGANLEYDVVEIGEKVYLSGNQTGIAPNTWESLRRTQVFLKAPITTPQGGGFKSVNVTTRKALGLYANIRPCVAYSPYVTTHHPKMDVVIVRENEEDLYAGIEYRQSDDVYQCLKLISRPGSEKIIRYAFEYAKRNGRKKVTCVTKDNIMKMTDGLFHKIFDEMGTEYPDIEKEHYILDIGAARLADTPERFDVMVMLNLYGDVLSDIAAQITGSVGLGGSANIGDKCAMFEAIHGSAPTMAGQDRANPSGLLLGAVMMLVHIGKPDIADKVHNAWLATLESGIHTADVYKEGTSKQKVGTMAFADAVVAHLGKKPTQLKAADYSRAPKQGLTINVTEVPDAKKELIGVDVFIHWRGKANEIGERIQAAMGADFELELSNRGVKVWPDGFSETFCVDHWRCRFTLKPSKKSITHKDVLALLSRISDAGFDFVQVETLANFNGERGYSLGQGE